MSYDPPLTTGCVPFLRILPTPGHLSKISPSPTQGTAGILHVGGPQREIISKKLHDGLRIHKNWEVVGWMVLYPTLDLAWIRTKNCVVENGKAIVLWIIYMHFLILNDNGHFEVKMGEICNWFLISFCLPQMATQIWMDILPHISPVAGGKRGTELVPFKTWCPMFSTTKLSKFYYTSECGFIKRHTTIYNKKHKKKQLSFCKIPRVLAQHPFLTT